MAWLAWKRSMRDPRAATPIGNRASDGPPKAEKPRDLKRLFPHADDALIAWAFDVAEHPPTGTINCIALNEKGEMSATTTTSGMAWKIPGRVGDSPIIGGGLWLDQDIGGAGSTGRGEENMRVAGAHTVRREHAARDVAQRGRARRLEARCEKFRQR